MNNFPPVAQEFFYFYSRMEFAIKKERMLHHDASANWDQFARTLGRAFYNQIVETGVANYLIANPPRKQIVAAGHVLDWEELGAISNTKKLFSAIRTARNNLFHGGKFPRGYLADSARDEQLLAECIAVLNGALEFNQEVAQEFYADRA